MTHANINARLVMKHDTEQNWNTYNPVLMAGEIGCAIDSDNGIVTVKIGDGVHGWRDLEMRIGTKENNSNSNSMSLALNKSDYKAFKTAWDAAVRNDYYKLMLKQLEEMKPVKVVFEGELHPSQEAAGTLTKMHKEQEQENPYLKDFSIPHYDFEDMDITKMIDF